MTAAADRMRLDELLVTRGLASSRSQARALIEAGKVESHGEILKKPGRAYAAGGYTYALGSNQNMGLWNVFVTNTLKQTSTNYYVIGTCP